MKYRIDQKDDLACLRVDEKYATWGTGADEIKTALVDLVVGGNHNIIVDLSVVQFADSSMLGALIAGLKIATRKRGAIKIVGSNTQIRAIFEQTRLHRVFSVYESEEDAEASFRGSA